MKKETKNPYATNEGGKIDALHTPKQPSGTLRRSSGTGDLRNGR